MAAFELDPTQYSLNIDASAADLGSHQITGFAEGTMITVERSEDQFTLKTSGDGKVDTFVKRPSRIGTIQVVLDEASPSNDFLNSLAKKDEDSSTGVVSISMKDNSGQESAFSPQARIQRRPGLDKGSDAGTRTWVFLATRLQPEAKGGTQLT